MMGLALLFGLDTLKHNASCKAVPSYPKLTLFILNNANLQSFKNTESHRLLNQHIRSLLEVLQPRERKVLETRFGLNDGQGRTLEEVGAMFGVCRERIRQLEAKGLTVIRQR